jgi:hypothetical protein
MENQSMENQSMVNQMPKVFEQAEWCFQFGNEDPIVFAWSEIEEDPGEFCLIVRPEEGSAAEFSSPDKKKTFKIFAREMSLDSKKTREEYRMRVAMAESGSKED